MERRKEDIMRVLVATDNHLGYGEKELFRSEDSFIAFEEVLEYAVVEDVDFILLGGDLFHDAVPSQNAMEKCMTLLRKYTLGSKQITVEFLNDESDIFHNNLSETVNYEDPNINIAIPVFSIHGNHDEPIGLNRLSSLDLLSTNGLLNYFGRWKDLMQVEIKPVLLRKGETKLAMYGLSHIHDSRLARLFQNHKVVMNRFESDDWFNLLVIHQNRANRGVKNFLPEEALPNFLNLVIWGHEHDCYIEPELNVKQGFYVSQPGSSVATSLSEGEARKKHIGLLEICKTQFILTPLPLKTVRPFVFDSITIPDIASRLNLDKGDITNKVLEMARERVEEMIKEAEAMLTDHPKQPKLPLIRLRLIYSEEEQMFNTIRFGQTFNDRVANPTDMVIFKKQEKKKAKKEPGIELDKETFNEAFEKVEQNPSARVEDLLEEYFENVKISKPQILPAKMMSALCFQLVERNDDNAAESLIANYKKKALSHLMQTVPTEDQIDEELYALRDKIMPDDINNMCYNENSSGNKKTTAGSNATVKRATNAAKKLNGNDANGTLTATATAAKTSTAARGRGGSRATRGSAAAADAASTTITTTRATRTSTASATNSRNQSKAAPALNISINAKQPARGAKMQKVYVISDSDDSP